MRAEKRRLAVLTAIINPKHSFRNRLAALTDEQREAYQRWFNAKRRQSELMIDCIMIDLDENGDDMKTAKYAAMYEASLDDDLPEPYLDKRIRVALFGEEKVITTNMTVEQAAEVYQSYLDER